MSVKEYDSTNKILKLIAGGTLWADCPLGTINAFGGATAPEGWLLCQGQALSRTTYKDLFDVIGTSFGSGDGSTTFNLPDLRGEFLRGAGTNSHSGQGNGGSVGTHQDGSKIINAIVGNGYGTLYVQKNGITNGNTFDKWVGNAGDTHLIDPTGYETTHYDDCIGTGIARPTNTSVNYIMKVKQTPMPADLRAALEDFLDNKNMLTWG